jgi:hypothetical protein
LDGEKRWRFADEKRVAAVVEAPQKDCPAG